MPSERFQFISGLAIPELDGFVAPASYCLTIWAEGDASNATGMPSERFEFISGLAIPELDRLIGTSTCDSLTIRTEGHARDITGMPIERFEIFALTIQ